MSVVIIDYGAGNIASVQHALRRIQVEAILSHDIATISKADKIIFPGVGQAKTAMNKLKERHLDQLIPNLKQPVLGICLGMQLMCMHSEEDNTSCLGIIGSNVKKFIPANVQDRIPHMGWAALENISSKIIPSDYSDRHTYFVHNYYVEINPNSSALSTYMHPFSAAIEQDNFYGVQFHPEKSGTFGELILDNFMKL